MPAPAISSQALSDYAITTEEYTAASCIVTNTPIYVYCIIDGIPFPMYQYSGTTYRREIFGYDIGIVSAETVTFIAINATGSDMEVAGSTISVTSPIISTFGISKVTSRLLYLIKHPEEYGGNNTLPQYNTFKDFGGLPKDIKEPIIWVHPIRTIPSDVSIDDDANMLKTTVQLTVNRILSDTNTNLDAFLDAEAAVRYLISNNPHLEISNQSSLVEHSKITNVTYPDLERGYFTHEMKIDIEFIIDTRS